MVTAHCTRCLGKAQGKTFEEASSKINHAVSLSRGIPCGDNYNCVEELKDKSTDSFKKVESKSSDIIHTDESKTTSSKKPKKQ